MDKKANKEHQKWPSNKKKFDENYDKWIESLKKAKKKGK